MALLALLVVAASSSLGVNMPINLGIYGNIVQPDVSNALQAYSAGQQARAQAQQNRLAAMQMEAAQRQQQQQDALNNAYKGNIGPDGQVNYAGVQSALAGANAGAQIPGVAKAAAEEQNLKLEQAAKVLNLQKSQATQVMAAPTLANALSSLDSIEALTGKGSMDGERARLTVIGDNPEQINAWAAGHALDAEKLLPHFSTVDTGGQVQTVGINPLTGQTVQTGSIAKTEAPGQAEKRAQDARAQADLAEYHRKMVDVAKNKAGGGMQIIDDQGNAIGGSGTVKIDALVDGIGKYQLSPKTALARIPADVRAAVIQRVREKYPEWDETTFNAKDKAGRDFTTGKQGDMLRSFATAGEHLDQLGSLVTAMDNGNTVLFNRVANTWAAQTGQPAPTNFDAAKDIVAKEVMKAIIAGGGGQAEREELAKQLSNAKSLQQLSGVIEQYRGLMSAQYENLMKQRDAAGLPASTLPKYSQGSGGNKEPTHGYATHQEAYADYVKARTAAYQAKNMGLVRKMDAEARADGLIK